MATSLKETTLKNDSGELREVGSKKCPRSLHCIAVGTDPSGRERRIKVRLAGTSFALIDNRRRCRVEAHWTRAGLGNLDRGISGISA
jgi:hypothetical protein